MAGLVGRVGIARYGGVGADHALAASTNPLVISTEPNPNRREFPHPTDRQQSPKRQRWPQRLQSVGHAPPRIATNGVRMYDVPPNESGGWPTRVPGDDTYAYGELIAMEVSFSENVSVSNEATFRVQIGSSRQDLAPVSNRGNTVVFAALVRATDVDTDGIWIGDHTATLDHNPADYFQTANGGSNVSLTHDSLGTQANHKVDGQSRRPKVTQIRITSSPQHREAYVRGEPVQLELTFDRAVVVSGSPEARLRIGALAQTASRTANYISGSGTSRLAFEYTVSLSDSDSDGVAIPANALAKDGDLAMGTEGGGDIKGTRGTVRADLTSGALGNNGSHKVDARYVAVPEIEIMADALWGWDTQTGASDFLTMDFTVREDPGHFSEDYALAAALGWSSVGSTRFNFGIQTDVDDPNTDGSEGKGIFINLWGAQDTTQARPADDGWAVTGSTLGDFTGIRKPYDWSAGDYSVIFAQSWNHSADGVWYGLWIRDISSSMQTYVGSLKFPTVDGAPPMINPRRDGYSSSLVIQGDATVAADEIPVFEIGLSPPNENRPDEGNSIKLPKRITASYSNLPDSIINAKVSHDRDSNAVVMRAGGTTNHFNAPGPTLIIRNDAATGTPVVEGLTRVGVPLWVDTSEIADADGPANPSFAYQWVRHDGNSDSDIPGAVNEYYTLTGDDLDKNIKVRVSFVDDAGYAETLISAPTAVVIPEPNIPASGSPAITGAVQVGEMLTADISGISDDNGLDNVSFNCRWMADDTEIDGATGTSYTLTRAEQGKAIRVRVSFTDDRGYAETLTSAATEAVAAEPNISPSGTPTITGTVQVKETLTVNTSGIIDDNGLGNVAYAYQWLADDTDIDGATGSSYTLTPAELGKTIKVRVSFTDDRDYPETLTSAATDAVAEEPNIAATGRTHHHWHSAGGSNAEGQHVWHQRRQRPGQRFVQFPLDGRRNRNLRGDRHQLHAHACRTGQGDHGAGVLHR